VDRERREPLRPETEERLLRSLFSALKRLDALVLSDYDKGLVTDNFAERVLSACHSCAYRFRKAKNFTPVCLSRCSRNCLQCQGSRLFRYSLPGRRKSVEEAGRALLAHFGCGAVLITRGEKGMSLIEETASRPLHVPATGFEVTYARVDSPALIATPPGGKYST